MADYPVTLAEAQETASAIARDFANFECTDCSKKIAQALGPRQDSTVVKLRVSDGSSVIGLRAQDRQISQTGHHVGVRVGDIVFDNLHPNGLAADEWLRAFVSGTGATLSQYERSLAKFFGERFRSKEFDRFASSRRQDS
jgi:Papain fold toxin 2